jgi:hypothetical protein
LAIRWEENNLGENKYRIQYIGSQNITSPLFDFSKEITSGK